MKIVSGVWKPLAVLLAVAGALSLAVRLLTWFAVYDDEGYMLVTLAHYVHQGHLYTQTFSQYGPFYFYAQGIFFQLLHLPVTHDMGRLVTLIYWLLSSLLGAVFVYRLAKSIVLASAAGFCIMLVGLVLTSEPGHSQEVLLPLYLAAACLAQISLAGRYEWRLFLLGCVAAALVFTKVNVGVFFIAGLAQSLICLLPSGKIRSMGLALTLLYAASVPWALMHGSFDLGFRGYCILATVSTLVTFLFGALVRPASTLPWRAPLSVAAGLLAGTALIVIGTLLQGMSPRTLLAGVVLNPMHHSKVFDIPLYLGGRHVLLALALIAVVVILRFWRNHLFDEQWFNILRCAIGVVSILLLTLPDSTILLLSPLLDDPLKVLVESSVHRIQWVVPLLPLALIPQLHWKHDAGELFSRLFITFMAVTQFLEPYPVAGSQMGIAAAPMILWAFVMIADGITGLRATLVTKRVNEVRSSFGLDTLVGSALLIVLAGLSIHLSTYNQFPPVPTKLRGSNWLHRPSAQVANYESLVQNVSANCSVLFTMPGMASFNMWSEVPTPNGWNLTAWMNGFPAERQAEILGLVKADPRSCAIVNPAIVHFWDRDEGSVAALPLAHYVTTDMPKVAQFGDYEIHVNPERTTPWVGSGYGVPGQ
jgi:hypothetical protein